MVHRRMVDVLVGFLGGMGLFFMGLKTVGEGVRSLAGRRFRDLFLRWTKTKPSGAFLGYLAGIAFQSTSALSLLLASLIGAGAVTVPAALPVLIGANAGVASLVLMAVLDIKTLFLVLLGLSGLVAAFEWPGKLVRAGVILFGVGLLLLGLDIVRTSAAPLANEAWFKAFLGSRDMPALYSFLIGTAACLLLQTAAGVSILAITLASSGVLAEHGALAVIYGSLFGSSLLSRFYAISLRGSRKRLVMGQVLFNLVGLCLFLPPFVVETVFGVPLLDKLAWLIFDDIEDRLTFLRILFDSATALVLLLALPVYNRLLERLCPDEEDSLAVLEYLKELPNVSPETAIVLANREQGRLMRHMPAYLARLRKAIDCATGVDVRGVHQSGENVLAAVDECLAEIALNTASGEQANAVAILRENQGVIRALSEALRDVVGELSGAAGSPWLSQPRDGILESLDTLILLAAEAFESRDPEQWDLLMELTRDKGPSMERMRQRHLDGDCALVPAERLWLLRLTGLYERAVWLLNRLAHLQRRFLADAGLRATGAETIRNEA